MHELELSLNTIPVMGAWLQFLPAIAGIAGKLFSGASQGRADGRAAEVGVTQGQDAATLDRARLAEDQAQRQQNTALDMAGIDIDRREYADKSRATGYKDRLQGGLLQGLQDFEIEPPAGITMGKISGGLRPSAILNKESLGRDMERGAIQRGLEGPKFADVEQVDGPAIPGLSELPKAGKLDSFLNIASLISNLAGGVGEAANVVRGARGGGDSTASTPNAARGNASRVFRGAKL